MRESTSLRRTSAGCVGILVMLTLGLSAHDAHTIGAYRLEIGWADEPALVGMRNAVTVEVTEAASHAPVSDLGGGALSVEVTFGSERLVLPLRPDPEQRNAFRAAILPTRPGEYAFHVTGRVGNQAVDIRSVCSPKTFDCVVASADIQFPVKDPSTGEIAERIERSSPRADRALALARRAQLVALAALGAAALAVAVAIGTWTRRRTRGD